MASDDRSRSWWHTVPGVITGIAAAITALSGLVVAVAQTGWFGTRNPPAATAPAEPAPSSPDLPALGREPGLPPPPSGRSDAVYPIPLPTQRDYRLGPDATKATFTLLKGEVSPQTGAKDALEIRVRMMNHDRYDKNFWDEWFRLSVDGVPTAPESGLNEVVPARSAKDGAVRFVIPRGATVARLIITYFEDSTEIPLDLAPPR
jgi:hypothetical protein